MAIEKVREYLKPYGKDQDIMEFSESSATVELAAQAVGGVCPFANPEQVKVYLDDSMKRFDTVYPAAGSASSAIPLTCGELEKLSHAEGWVDVCKEAF